MATRLYPLTQKPENLEKLAGVPAGTFKALTPYREVLLNWLGSDEAFEAASKAVGENPDMVKLSSFLDKGYGRVGDAILGIHAQSQQVVGSTDIRHVAMLHGLSLSNDEISWTEGLCWY